MLKFYQSNAFLTVKKSNFYTQCIKIRCNFRKLYNKSDRKINRTNFLLKPLDKAVHLFYNMKQNKSAEHLC